VHCTGPGCGSPRSWPCCPRTWTGGPLDPAARDQEQPGPDPGLARWLDVRKELGISPRATLFCTLGGTPLSADYVRGLLHRLAAVAGITKPVHPHGWRHTFAVELERAGMPVSVISKLLGHSSVAVTARYLEHLTNSAAVTALAAAELPMAGQAGFAWPAER
jgi:integrase